MDVGGGWNIRQSHLQQICALSVDSTHQLYRMTNIVCTVGPACDSVAALCELIEKGMNICRFNLAHGDYKYHLSALHNLRDAVSQTRQRIHSQVATAVDITGSGIRVGTFKEGIKLPVCMKKGDVTTFTSDETCAQACQPDRIYIPQKFIDTAKVGEPVFIEDGPLCFVVQEKDDNSVKCLVVQEGEIGDHNQCHTPLVSPVDSAELSERDKQDISFCVEHNMDIIFVSWVCCPEMITNVREQLGEAKSTIKIIAKIESHEGVKRIDEILAVADGVMVARGDLGIDIAPEKVFLAQKMIIGRANMAGKPVICAAQMLDSMVTNPRPTRAEASDVANAILDGADCVMLSRETAMGKNPGRAVETLAAICTQAESALYYARMFSDLKSVTQPPTDIIQATAIAAVEAAFRCRASAIVVVTNSGRSATQIARYRPHCIIIAITKSHHTARSLNLYRGIFSVLHTGATCDEWFMDIDMRINYALTFAKDRGYIKTRDTAILVTGYQSGPGSTNTVRCIVIPHEDEAPHYLNIPHTLQHLYISEDSYCKEEDSQCPRVVFS